MARRESQSESESESLLPRPFGSLAVALSDPDLRHSAYEIFVSACRTSAGSRPLTYTPQSQSQSSPSSASSSSSSPSPSPSLQRSLTSAAASKVKKALGLKSKSKTTTPPTNKDKPKPKPATIADLMRIHMSIPDHADARIRRALLRIAATQLGRRVESMVLPLELLQQFKPSDFPDPQDYDSCRTRYLTLLQAGLLLHPFIPLEPSHPSAHRLRQILRTATDRPIETGRNSESMQLLRTAVLSLATRSFDGSPSDSCHWADGSPLNLYIYQKLLEACFEIGDEASLIDEVDEVLELIKKTWTILGVTQIYHNLCFTWVLFNQYVTTGQLDTDLLLAADAQLAEVAKDAKTNKDPVYCKILSSTLSSIMGWAEKRLLAYHEAFNASNIEAMQFIVSLGVCSAQILVEDISHEYRRRRKGETDVARSTIDAYIRSSLRTAFAQRMEEVDLNRRSGNKYQNTPTPILSILAKDIGDLAKKEKDLFSPIFKKWHPLAAGVAVATLHSCYGNELKQFISGLAELTSDSVQVLKSADKLEKDLVSIAVEDSVDSEDGGKGLIREMPPYEAEMAIANLVRDWIKTRVDRLKDWVDRNLQQETWNPGANRANCAPSAVEVLRIIDETLDAYFQLPIPMHRALLPDLTLGLDRSLQHYASKAKSGCGTKNTFIPAIPALTRCEVGSKLWKKKEKPTQTPPRRSQVGSMNGRDSLSLPQLCTRLNTIYHIRSELENLEKKIKTCLRNVENAHADITDGLDIKFELSLSSCQEAIQTLCETTAYKVVFHDMSHVLWESLYLGDTASNRIDSFIKELDPTLEVISGTVHNRVRNRVITALMKAAFDGLLLVLLAGGPQRAFTRQDSQILEEDFKSLKALFLADGDGLPDEVVEKASSQAKNVLTLFRADSETLVERYKRMVMEAYGSAVKSRFPLPPTTGNWSPNEANTLLRVLCYRNDEAATRFLKKTYNLPKKL
ncbi:hypothetical protein LUZ63_004534 [Rhynchospora breviuscula]|uniref:Protein unc-13 homolog n=1 Tax=Rhynchospora breviuscula TaxID=2022672 RepID=A0A9Q0D2R5_9POAL|nr:hypothetical protein LUZ63_004534 [Rhynchospora breviuscula]